jgi:hypothetical protein
MSEEPGMRASVPASKAAVVAPIVADRDHSAPSAFTPENLLREARRQKRLAATTVPEVCVLDPDGDMVRRLRAAGRAHRDPGWAAITPTSTAVPRPGWILVSSAARSAPRLPCSLPSSCSHRAAGFSSA